MSFFDAFAVNPPASVAQGDLAARIQDILRRHATGLGERARELVAPIDRATSATRRRHASLVGRARDAAAPAVQRIGRGVAADAPVGRRVGTLPRVVDVRVRDAPIALERERVDRAASQPEHSPHEDDDAHAGEYASPRHRKVYSGA